MNVKKPPSFEGGFFIGKCRDNQVFMAGQFYFAFFKSKGKERCIDPGRGIEDALSGELDGSFLPAPEPGKVPVKALSFRRRERTLDQPGIIGRFDVFNIHSSGMIGKRNSAELSAVRKTEEQVLTFEKRLATFCKADLTERKPMLFYLLIEQIPGSTGGIAPFLILIGEDMVGYRFAQRRETFRFPDR